MKHFTIMIKPASSLCNMRCKYCFYADVSDMREVKSFGIMTAQTVRLMLDNTFCDLEVGDSVCFAFQGGEPTLAGIDYYRSFIEEVAVRNKEKNNGCKVSYVIQTNAILLDEEWCKLFKEHEFLVGVSLDGSAAMHDMNRLDSAGSGTYSKIVSSIKMLGKYEVPFNVLTVLTNSAARHPGKLWSFYQKLGIQYVQFIPCLDDLDSGTTSPYALTPGRFASFYKQFFAMWLADWKQGIYTSIKLFDDIVNLLVDGSQTACGILGNCSPQIIVEADGSVYPCDFFVLDEYRVGNITEQKISTLLGSPTVADFASGSRSTAEICKGCKYTGMCGGGCKRMRSSVCFHNDGTYCGYRDFLDETIDDMSRIAAQVRRRSAI